MKRRFRGISAFSMLAVGMLALGGALALSGAEAQEDAAATASVDEERIIQRAKEEILEELREGDLIREQVELGIQEYIRKQRETQAAARAGRQRAAAEKAKNVRPVSSERDHIYGDPDAIVSLIEYSDFECPYCKRFHLTAKKLVDDSGGKVNWVYRHFPLSFHNPGAQKQAEASECASEQGGNTAFWTYTDEIYSRTKSNGRGFPLDKLVPLAEELGLDGVAFDECLKSKRYAARVTEDFEEGRTVGITGTPGNILINNETGEVRLKSGAVPYASLQAEIDQLLQ
jgi:protein-disulfide isomerase